MAIKVLSILKIKDVLKSYLDKIKKKRENILENNIVILNVCK